jgi:hypothetical protein
VDDSNKESFDRLRAEMKQGHQRIAEKLQEMTTEIVRVFNTFAQINNNRGAELEGNEGAFGTRLANLEGRILECERRLNIPPAAFQPYKLPPDGPTPSY